MVVIPLRGAMTFIDVRRKVPALAHLAKITADRRIATRVRDFIGIVLDKAAGLLPCAELHLHFATLRAVNVIFNRFHIILD